MITDSALPYLSAACVALVGWLVTAAFNRLYLSPLAQIPGPKLAALTFLYEIYYDVVQPGRYVFKIKRLHERYGPIIRVTPREVHIQDARFLDTIYPASNLSKRDKDWHQTRGLDVGMSTSGTISHDLHRRRREALSPFFSQKNVMMLESLIKQKVVQLCDLLDENLRQAVHTPLNLSDLYYALARDVVFQYSFGKDSNVLGNLENAASLRRNLNQLLQGVKATKHFHSFFRIIKTMPISLSRWLIPPGAKNMRDLTMAIRSEIKDVLDNKANERKPRQRSIFYDLCDDPNLPSAEKQPERLQQEGTMLVMAATDATAKVIGISHFHLLANPPMMSKLRAELSTLGPDASVSQLQPLAYLSAVCNEGNRLAFGLTGRNARVCPEEALQYRDYFIPAGTPLSTTTLSIHTDEDIFPDPWRFDPDRWLGPEREQRLKYHLGFGKGARRCLGYNLANAEVWLTIAAVARYDLELFETDASDVEFRHDFQVAHPKLGSKGIRTTVQGKL